MIVVAWEHLRENSEGNPRQLRAMLSSVQSRARTATSSGRLLWPRVREGVEVAHHSANLVGMRFETRNIVTANNTVAVGV
jgi:hypothetical protein